MDCPHILEIAYGDFSQRLHREADSRRLPVAGSLELTERCNLRCLHCWINKPQGDGEARQQELPGPEWSRLLTQMAAEGCLWLLFTGGEPLLHPDFREIYLAAKNQGLLPTLFTNGTLITPGLADFLKEFPPFVVEITLYGRTQATYEAVTRVPGSFAQCLRGIELLRSRQVPLALKSVVMTVNAHEVRAMQDWARSLGLRFRYDPMLNARLDGGHYPWEVRLSPEEVVAFDLEDKARLQDLLRLFTNFTSPPPEETLYTCGAGISAFHVDAYGQIYPCIMSRGVGYDLRRGTFREAWRQFMPEARRLKPPQDYPCGDCEFSVLCLQCPGWAGIETGDPKTLVPFLCQVTRLQGEMLRQSMTE
ncbi:MAG: hypothetical protein A2Y80_10455 [Deltaproteobacteria bacterium RBG_13_58_19]|nr:MAG: hypothetical protein A2Y80_10455 [Deltaproteobacteria bacterium RBG_13_58_19]